MLIYRSFKIFCTGLCALSMLITLNRVNWSSQEEHVSQFSSDEQLHSNYMEDKYFNDLIDMAGHIQLSGYLYIFRLFSLCLICLFLSKVDLSKWISSLVVWETELYWMEDRVLIHCLLLFLISSKNLRLI